MGAQVEGKEEEESKEKQMGMFVPKETSAELFSPSLCLSQITLTKRHAWGKK